MAKPRRITRRSAVQLGAAAAALPLVHIRTAGAAGKLVLGFWDHWVPKGSEVLRDQVLAWADHNKVDVRIDFITSTGNKLALTAAAEAQAGTGHDVLPIGEWDVYNYAKVLEPVDDVANALTTKYGRFNPSSEYLAKVRGHWMAVPSATGTVNLSACARISLMKSVAGIDLPRMFPAHPTDPSASADWTYDTFLKAAEACNKAGCTFAIGLGSTNDSVNAAAVIFAAFGAEIVDSTGKITVGSDKVREALEYGQRLVKFLPRDTISYDDASNNRALISGKTALIFNPPSAWAVAKRDAPHIAADCWTFPNPAGPNGRFVPYIYGFWGIWSFSRNKTAAKELLLHLSQREQVEERTTVVVGYDIPVLQSMSDFKVWEEVEPPKGTVYNYPIRPWHNSIAHVAGAPAPPEISVQIYNRAIMPGMLARLYNGSSIKETIDWAQNELEGFVI